MEIDQTADEITPGPTKTARFEVELHSISCCAVKYYLVLLKLSSN